MRETLLIIKREFRERVASKSFLYGTLLFPLLMIALIILPRLVGRGGSEWHLALVSEAAGDLPPSRIWIGEAVERNRRDWRLWLVAARIEAKLGRTRAAERSLRRAIALNPRSPLFEGLLDPQPAG